MCPGCGTVLKNVHWKVGASNYIDSFKVRLGWNVSESPSVFWSGSGWDVENAPGCQTRVKSACLGVKNCIARWVMTCAGGGEGDHQGVCGECGDWRGWQGPDCSCPHHQVSSLLSLSIRLSSLSLFSLSVFSVKCPSYCLTVFPLILSFVFVWVVPVFVFVFLSCANMRTGRSVLMQKVVSFCLV